MEYRILTKSPSELQKTLNQWRHDYDINILGVTAIPSIPNPEVICILTRTEKTIPPLYGGVPDHLQ